MDSVMEVLIATVLSVGGLMTSWASYQAALWDGEQAAHYSHANALRVMASRVRLEADERRGLQMMLFNSWLQAKARDDATLAAFYERRFPPDMRPAVNAWLLLHPLKDPTAPPSPFAMPAYRPDGMAEATRLEGEADATFEHGQSDNRISDLFTQGAVYMATAMFFGGIGQVFRMRSVRVGLLAVAIVACAIGLSRIVSLPLLKPG
jgi:hypothetical protein